MNSKFYYKYIDFLKSHSLYDEDFFDFFWNNAIFIKLKDNDYSYLVGNVIIITNEQKRIEFIIPSVPYLKSEYFTKRKPISLPGDHDAGGDGHA